MIVHEPKHESASHIMAVTQVQSVDCHIASQSAEFANSSATDFTRSVGRTSVAIN